mmetsp:Transcript_30695/g.53800  ORF Transcript_30695/g.53800 Transcript_30695/m.53800 type:complete len:163 (-) Transcript_30695:32-520(-)
MKRQAYCPVTPKNLFYRSNGSGRDVYITYDNGGAFFPNGAVPKSSSMRNLAIRPKSAGTIAAKSLKYNPDGTGRDGYIKVTDGGLHFPGPRAQAEFKSSLRNYQPLVIDPRNDPYTWTQTAWLPKKSLHATRSQSRIAQDCVDRLYRPKTTAHRFLLKSKAN